MYGQSVAGHCCCCSVLFVNSFVQNTSVDPVAMVERAVVQLTRNPADFDEVMLSLVSVLSERLSETSIVENIVANIYAQVCLLVTAIVIVVELKAA